MPAKQLDMKHVVTLLLLMTIVASACNTRKADEEQMKKAADAAGRFYLYMQIGDKTNAQAQFSNGFYANADTASWEAFLNKSKKRPVASFVLASSEVSVNHLGTQKEKEIDLTFKVIYNTGQPGKEKFMFILSNGQIGKIDGYETDTWHMR